jgi:hypothetical protein
MRTLRVGSIILGAVLIVAGCANQTNGGETAASAAATGPAASPKITTTGTTVEVTGLGGGQSAQFALGGPAAMTVSTCASNGTTPFVWVYSAAGATIAEVVQPAIDLSTTSGKYYIVVSSNPDCAWTIDFKPK